MAIISTTETLNSRTLTARMRETSTYTRSWMVKVDDPGEPWANISNAPPVRWGDYHPEDTSVIAAALDIRPSGDLLLYEVVWTYEAPAAVDSPDAGSSQPPTPPDPNNPGGRPVDQLPADVWSGTTSLNAVPVTVDRLGNPITNSADVPFPDLTALRPFAKLELTRSYTSLALLTGEMRDFTGAINSVAWAGGDQFTWLCEGCRWQKQTMATGGSALIFYSATWGFSYDSRGWYLETVDRGYMERDSNGKLVNIMIDGSPAADPVPLNLGKAQLTGDPNTITAFVYPAVALNYWGQPS